MVKNVIHELAGVKTTSSKTVLSLETVVVVNSHTVLTVVLVITGGLEGTDESWNDEVAAVNDELDKLE